MAAFTVGLDNGQCHVVRRKYPSHRERLGRAFGTTPYLLRQRTDTISQQVVSLRR